MQPEICISYHIRVARIHRKTLLIGSDDVLRQYRRSSDHFAKYLTKHLGTSCTVSDEDDNVIHLPFLTNRSSATQYFQDYIRKRVQCVQCKSLDTAVAQCVKDTHVLICFNCGNRIFDWSE